MEVRAFINHIKGEFNSEQRNNITFVINSVIIMNIITKTIEYAKNIRSIQKFIILKEFWLFLNMAKIIAKI